MEMPLAMLKFYILRNFYLRLLSVLDSDFQEAYLLIWNSKSNHSWRRFKHEKTYLNFGTEKELVRVEQFVEKYCLCKSQTRLQKYLQNVLQCFNVFDMKI